ncbi:hypothetical protein HDV02_002831 [Globomyces sp. JEL0801]|nr:hypothetical protein HDV02_002831 [Globomyces sp. JEL0801]
MSQTEENGSSAILSESELKDFKAAFELFDRDNDGTITTKELGTALKGLGQNPTEAELQDLILELDEDGNGTIEFEELMALITKHNYNVERNIEMKQIFQLFDRDQDGYISLQDLTLVVKTSGAKLMESEIENMLLEADLDGDHRVDFNEFISIIEPELNRVVDEVSFNEENSMVEEDEEVE